MMPCHFSIIFSGDLGCTDTPILPDPDTPGTCDLLVLESTYGGRNHTNRKDRVNTLEKLLHKALADKGIVYIPAFSLGRTQELIIEKQTPVRAGIHTLTGYSAHADQNMLVNWVKSMPMPPGEITLVHGEPKAQKALSRALGL